MVLEERPPDDFRVAARYKPKGLAVSRDSALIALVWCIGTTAVRPWNEAFRAAECSTKPFVDIKMVVGNIGTLRSKHIIWSLAGILDFWTTASRAHFAETSWLTTAKDEPLVAFGSVTSKLAEPVDMQPTGGSLYNDTQAGNLSDILTVPASSIGLLVSPYDRVISITSAVSFYSLLVQGLLRLAETPSEQRIDELQSVYDDQEDLTLAWGPTSTQAGSQGLFTADYAIGAILRICDHMASNPVAERYYAFRATIQKGRGSYVGRLALYKGKIEPTFRPVTENGPYTEEGGEISVVRR